MADQTRQVSISPCDPLPSSKLSKVHEKNPKKKSHSTACGLLIATALEKVLRLSIEDKEARGARPT